MKTKSQTDRIIDYLTKGTKPACRELPNASRKYRKFTTSNPNSYYFVGRKGAVRCGRNQSSSFSITGAVVANMEAWESGRKI